ncbi:LysR family transcriptional regulator [Parapusillimonas granuli]|uniref:LysR family transcriptional regulator n=1 Tax=Parapusillimonas granuli TaxID=380911 RepID=A0A853FU01_9BURK|nr:LysR family transcriptional regulator [Parapusillimonas granuli]MBB5216632.1 DNA-binding transcriptional LysR family regulator [Parapusillimonas granuli]MEB2401871.1 LysR family transcriptional regulator [Alcaligenaceae bacterium]NYT48063.1 LysR family transcriptional regulator [Parapusillimonas granuli]
MNVTLRQLRAFLAVARTGSFTLAAESLYITQSALSGLIKELEQTLGARLIDRSTRRVYLTEIGEHLYPTLEGVLHDLDGALRQAVDQRDMKTGLVRIAASQLLASTLMPDLIAAFQALHPMIQVRLVDTPVEAVMARVFAGEVELGIGPEREPNSDITSTRLFDGPFMAVFPAGHALDRHKRLRWADLASHPVITLQGQFTGLLIRDLRASAPELAFAPSTEVAFMSTALSMVKSGLGVALCIPYAASLIEVYGLRMRPVASPEVYRSFEVFTRRGRTLSPAAQSFLDFIGPRIRAMPYLR